MLYNALAGNRPSNVLSSMGGVEVFPPALVTHDPSLEHGVNGVRYVGTAEAASMLGLRPQTLSRWRCEGSPLPWVRLSKRAVRYSVEEVIKFAESRKVVSTAQGTADARYPSSSTPSEKQPGFSEPRADAPG